jgi:hypothetical protein
MLYEDPCRCSSCGRLGEHWENCALRRDFDRGSEANES